MSFFQNAREPVGLGGRLMVRMMNLGHRALAGWGFGFLSLPEDAAALDCGCGGGANLKKLLRLCPKGSVRGVDVSAVSVEKSRRLNRRAIAAGRCEVLRAGAAALPFGDGQFDLVTAFETVYFWPDLPRCFREVRRVLKHGGTFFVCNECGGDRPGDEKWTKRVDGMTVYRDAQLRTLLERAGFADVQVHKDRRGWLCLSAKKA